MALADLEAYQTALRRGAAADFQQSSAISSAPFLTDLLAAGAPAPVAPTASVALDRTSDRAINTFTPTASSGRMAILGGRFNPSGAGGVTILIVDVLNISGGLNATLTTPQTTNLPTAALTRYTSGAGVQAGLIMHAAHGTAASFATCSYTNQDGVSGRTSGSILLTNNARQGGNVRLLPLQAGDTGVRSVESVTLSASTATAGNFGVVLFKPLAMMFLNDVEGANVIDCISTGRMVGQFADYDNDACLSCYAMMSANQAISGAILVGEV